MLSEMSEWYDVTVRGILGSGKRDVREKQTLGRCLRWTDEGLEYEANDKQRQTLMEGMGLCKGSRAVNSASIKLDEIGREDDKDKLREWEGRGSEAWKRH